MSTSHNFSAANINGRDYYVTGETRYDSGKVIQFDEFVSQPIVCPHVTRYEPLPQHSIEGYIVTRFTCVKLTAEDHDAESERLNELMDNPDFWE